MAPQRTVRSLAIVAVGIAGIWIAPGSTEAVEVVAGAPAAAAPAGVQVAQAAAAGNVAAGMDTFMRQCRVCHTVVKGGDERFGPNLFGVVGKQAGTEPKFAYSDAFKKAATWKWDASLIGGWISNPGALIPGNAMAVFPGVADKDRDNVIAYLASLK